MNNFNKLSELSLSIPCNSRNMRLRDSEFFSYVTLARITFGVFLLNRINNFAWEFSIADKPLLARGVFYIVRKRAEKKMLRIYAKPYVALVENTQPIRYWPERKHPSDAMRRFLTVAKHYLAVSCIAWRTCPQPAATTSLNSVPIIFFIRHIHNLYTGSVKPAIERGEVDAPFFGEGLQRCAGFINAHEFSDLLLRQRSFHTLAISKFANWGQV